ncbi:N-acetylglutamate synthase-like GNAT family acetyltransferase [Mucilaginibacter frigoritolerans]|uniref:N-acetylglutamate synthase-like GNAT family acetyltransferase n=1 Tax=Mucilaginibacter frigoritolerans TaxID=652788 RepID=A0A562U160_9SPHI|nr:GNAT family N-acetyltransferase [Mucilaginibacter frigoritolerans]TWI99483.1 N-acetylglutamate synthase-like GNAT family acetyltransferase [Mucilaginibacter frigoritolerans]
MNNEIKIRPANINDLPGIKKLVTENLLSFGFNYDNGGSESDLENFAEVYQQPGSKFFVIYDGTDILGTVGLVKISDDVVKLRKMYVNSRLRDKGYGLDLLRTVVSEAKLLGYLVIRLETVHAMHRAIRLYTNFGFSAIPGEPDSKRCDITMELIL